MATVNPSLESIGTGSQAIRQLTSASECYNVL